MSGTPDFGTHVIVIANEKGGSGKSTLAMHVAVALLSEGFAVGTVDLDARQGSLSRMIENRRRSAELAPLLMPRHAAVLPGIADSRAVAEADEAARMDAALGELADCAFLVIDTPGADSALARRALSLADTLLTPMNDSYLDLDLLGRIDPDGKRILRPSLFSETVWDQRKRRALVERTKSRAVPIDWVVVRNRLSSLDARNKREIGRLLDELARRIAFRVAPGMTERVIFRELFPWGLTLLDLPRPEVGIALSLSHVAARQEVRALVAALNLPGFGAAADSPLEQAGLARVVGEPLDMSQAG